MSRCLLRAVLVAAILASFTFSANAQTGPTVPVREISGRVFDAAGLPVPGAIVALSNAATGLERIATSDATGSYRFTELGDDGYRVGITIDGFAPASRDATPGSRVDIELRPAQVVESVTVVSGARQAELRESLSTPVNVVTRSRLEDTARSSVGEVLREVPGVLTRRGSEATTVAGEQVQGIDSRQVLVLVDGQPIAGARGIKSGAINLDRQSTYRLERVEIVKGARPPSSGQTRLAGSST